MNIYIMASKIAQIEMRVKAVLDNLLAAFGVADGVPDVVVAAVDVPAVVVEPLGVSDAVVVADDKLVVEAI